MAIIPETSRPQEIDYPYSDGRPVAEAVEEFDPLGDIFLRLRIGGGDGSLRRAEPLIQRLVRRRRLQPGSSKKTDPKNENRKPTDRFHGISNLRMSDPRNVTC